MALTLRLGAVCKRRDSVFIGAVQYGSGDSVTWHDVYAYAGSKIRDSAWGARSPLYRLTTYTAASEAPQSLYIILISIAYIEMPNSWVLCLALALLFALYATLLSVYILVSPLPAIHLFGLDPCTAATVSPSPLVPFITIFGGRNFAIGLALLALHWQGMYRAMSTVLICCTVSGAVDMVVMSSWGMEGKTLGHGVGCVVLGLTGWSLLD